VRLIFIEKLVSSETCCALLRFLVTIERSPQEVWIHITSSRILRTAQTWGNAMQTYSFPEYVFIELRGMLLMVSLPDR
jgi:hypothetical protein